MYKDLTPLMEELRECLPPALPTEEKDKIINMMFFILSL